MARRKKIGKHKHHRRKRMGAAGGSFEIIFGALLGAVITDFADQAIALPQYVFGSLSIAAGAMGAYFLKGAPIAQGIGLGVAAKGAVVLMGDFSPSTSKGGLNGIDHGNVSLPRKIAGYSDVPSIGAFPKPAGVGSMYRGCY